MANDVAFQRDDYRIAAPDWAMVRTLCDGESKVKAAGEIYLPNPCVLGSTGESRSEVAAIYTRYLARALFLNVVGRTRSSLAGAVFRRTPKLALPSSIAYMAKDCDGAGVSIYQQSQSALDEVLSTGRSGLLVDYPDTGGAASVADMRAGKIRANIVRYDAAQIVNWQQTRVGGQSILTRIVLSEMVDAVDGFETKPVAQHRELALEEGRYVVRLWRKNAKGDWEQVSEAYPTTSTGAAWTVIPFVFVGALNNDAQIDGAPLFDLACVNRKHYQLGADWYNALYYAGNPQPVMAGLTEEWRNWLEEKGTVIGSRAILPLPAGGSFQYATVGADTAIQKQLDTLKDEMVALGARLIMPGEVSKTATQSAGEQEVSHSVVSLAAENVSDAYTQALQYAQVFMGGSGECEYRLNGDIAGRVLDPQMIVALVSAWQSGTVPKRDVQVYLQRVGLIDPEKSPEEIDDETAGEGINLG